jgi:hypothetical protein
MKNGLLLTAFVAIAYTQCFSQNFSGLQYKRLNKLSDAGTMLESGLGSLFGGNNKMSGNIDSVVVSWDSELMLRVKIYFTGFDNGFFTASAMNGARKQQNEIIFAKTTEAGARRPIEMTLSLDPKLPKGTKLESPYLRIDIAKDYNKLGKVYAFSLNKDWKIDLDPQNVIIDVALSPVGKAADLTSEVKDVTPTRTLKFDSRSNYQQPGINRLRRQGGSNQSLNIDYLKMNLPDDISGTWINTDADTKGITKLVVTNNVGIQGFGKCSPQDCDWGSTSLSGSGNTYKAVFSWSFKTTTLEISYADDQLNVAETDVRIPGGATSAYNYTFKKNLQMLNARASMLTLDQASSLANPRSFATVSTAHKGPSSQQFNLINSFSTDVDFKRPQDISNINLTAFLDLNPASGYVYVLPADYHLKWEPKSEAEKGYNFRILYGSQSASTEGTETTDAPVRMSATLTAGISSAELAFVRTLLSAAFNKPIQVNLLTLRENPQFTFQNTLGSQYNIPQNKILVETTTDLGGDIRVSWQTDADTKEFIQTALTSREGIAASVVLKPSADQIIDQLIPANINIADTRTLGKISLQPHAWRTTNWRNTTPYPLQLNYLHVLKKENIGTNAIIYSWSANGAVIPPQAQAAFANNMIPTWLDNAEGVVMWVDYSVMDCPECDKKVMDAVTGGVSGGKSQQVKFTIPPAVFDTLNASYFLVTIRSKQVDPKGEVLKELDALKITKEKGEGLAGPLFISTGGIEFEYKITVATADGDFFPAANWIKATSKDVLLGKTKMKEIFKGIVPGIE